MDKLTSLKTQLSLARSSLHFAEQAANRWPVGDRLYLSAMRNAGRWQKEIERLEAEIEAAKNDN